MGIHCLLLDADTKAATYSAANEPSIFASCSTTSCGRAAAAILSRKPVPRCVCSTRSRCRCSCVRQGGDPLQELRQRSCVSWSTGVTRSSLRSPVSCVWRAVHQLLALAVILACCTRSTVSASRHDLQTCRPVLKRHGQLAQAGLKQLGRQTSNPKHSCGELSRAEVIWATGRRTGRQGQLTSVTAPKVLA